jgi:hypothetical protein
MWYIYMTTKTPKETKQTVHVFMMIAHAEKSGWSLSRSLWHAWAPSAASPAGCSLSSRVASRAVGGKNAAARHRPLAASGPPLQIQQQLLNG